MVVTEVEKLEPLSLRKEWMNDLAQAAAFLESLNLAHGDLRPENILLDRNRLKLSDFDCTAEVGTDFEACIGPYGRVLNSNETNEGPRGSSGLLGPRTEQFALGSLYYLINYGFEVYGDRCLTEDPREHGPKVVDLLQNMEFPNLNGDILIDDIIDKCWHNKYTTVAELAAHTKTLLVKRTNVEGTDVEGTNAAVTSIAQWHIALGSKVRGLWSSLGHWLALTRQNANGEATNTEMANGEGYDDGDYRSGEGFSSKKAFCQDLEKRGILGLLSSHEPEQLGFTHEWYRYSSRR